MEFHFKLEKAKGGYYFDDENKLHPTEWFESTKTEEVIFAEEIHKKFVEILHPYHDLAKYLLLQKVNGRFSYNKLFQFIDKNHKFYDAKFESETKDRIIQFVNKFGLGVGNPETGSPEYINLDNTFEGFIDEPHGKGQKPNLYNILAKAIEINDILLTRKSYETIPSKLKNICNTHSMFLIPKINSSLYMETSSIWTTIYWGMAFTEFQYEVKQCRWCEAPLLTDVRANFCKLPRQCKNKFNNSRRPKKKDNK